MRFAHFFVDRPIFATVISLLLIIVGSIAYVELPVAQYPEIAPPTIVVRTSYPGADPQTIADTVSTPIEQEINGVEDMLYMSSYSSADGAMTLTITFKLGADLDKAQVLVQNRVAVARRPVEAFDTEVKLPDWQLEEEDEAYFGEPGEEGLTDENGMPIELPYDSRPPANPDGAPSQEGAEEGQILDQRWIDEQTGREPAPKAPPPANKAMPPAVKTTTIRVPAREAAGQNN